MRLWSFLLEQSLCSMRSESAYENKLFWARWITNRKLRTEKRKKQWMREFFIDSHNYYIYNTWESIYIQLDVVTNSSNQLHQNLHIRLCLSEASPQKLHFRSTISEALFQKHSFRCILQKHSSEAFFNYWLLF